MTASGVSLVDANVWLALAVGTHLHHAPARTWFDGQSDGRCAFCRITQVALLRHLTNSKVMGPTDVQSQGQAWQTCENIEADPRVVYLDEPLGLTPVFKLLTHSSYRAHKQWTDAYLAAFAECLSLEVVTFDTGFKASPGQHVQSLTPNP